METRECYYCGGDIEKPANVSNNRFYGNEKAYCSPFCSTMTRHVDATSYFSLVLFSHEIRVTDFHRELKVLGYEGGLKKTYQSVVMGWSRRYACDELLAMTLIAINKLVDPKWKFDVRFMLRQYETERPSGEFELMDTRSAMYSTDPQFKDIDKRFLIKPMDLARAKEILGPW